MKYKLYTTSVEAWDAMLEAIDDAQKSIYLEIYIFANDTLESHDFIGKLKKKALAGVRVVILADTFGSGLLKKEVEKTLPRSGIEFIFFSHWLRHIHRKILVVDEKIAFIGGVNIGKKYKHWSDLELRLSGRTVKTILKSFAYSYSMAGGKNPKILKYREKKFSAKLRFWLLEHWPSKNVHTLKNHYVEKITGALSSVQIVTPYFTPPRWLISLLDSAVRRGVHVEIIIPQKSDYAIVDRLNYRYIYDLCRLGMKFYLVQKMNHSKLLLIDGEEGLLGSQNIDHISFRIDFEAGVFFKEKKLLKELSQVVENWKRDSVEFEPKKYKMRVIDYIIFALIKIFRPIL